MPELDIREEHFGDVVVLHMRGGLRIGDSCITLRNTLRGLIEQGHQKFVLNLSGVKYIDSSGIGELLAWFTTISGQGGTIVLCSLTEKVEDLLRIGKYLNVLDATNDVKDALASLSVDHQFVVCPLDGCNSRVVFPHSPPHSPARSLSMTCSGCDAQFELELSHSGDASPMQGVIKSLRIPAYWEEYINVIIGSTSIIEMTGRFDLFVSDILRKAWQVVPIPRRIIFDISAAPEISQRALEILYELCSQDENDTETVILKGSSGTLDFSVPSIPIYDNREAAVAAFAGPAEENSHQLIVDVFEWAIDKESQG